MVLKRLRVHPRQRRLLHALPLAACGLRVPLLDFVVAIISLLDMACFHQGLGRRPVDALLEACASSTIARAAVLSVSATA